MCIENVLFQSGNSGNGQLFGLCFHLYTYRSNWPTSVTFHMFKPTVINQIVSFPSPFTTINPFFLYVICSVCYLKGLIKASYKLN